MTEGNRPNADVSLTADHLTVEVKLRNVRRAQQTGQSIEIADQVKSCQLRLEFLLIGDGHEEFYRERLAGGDKLPGLSNAIVVVIEGETGAADRETVEETGLSE